MSVGVAPGTPIALVITELERGGAEQAFTELAVGLDRNRFRPAVYCLSPRPENTERSFLPRLVEAGLPVTFLGLQHRRQFTTGLARLTQAWRRDRPRLVQTFLYHANLLGRIAAWRTGVPHVVSGIRVAEHRSRWPLRLDHWTQWMVERNVCVSRAVAEYSSTVAGLDPDHLVVIPNGVDWQRFRGAQAASLVELGLPAGHRAMIYVGRLDPQKGLDRLCEVLRGPLEHSPRYHLLVVGSGSQQPALERRIAELGLASRVHLLGWRSDVAELLRASDLLVLPSLWEGMPNVVLEAMSAALAVLAFDVEGVAEALGPAADRQVVRPVGDFQQFADQLTAMLSRPGLLAHLGIANQRRAGEEFRWEQMVASYQALYETLLAGDRAPSERPKAAAAQVAP